MKKIVYHGSNYIIEKPELKYGRETNDFGRGFYCSEDKELACEWACQRKRNGYTNAYELDCDSLKVLDLLDGSYSVLNWIALLLENRTLGLNNPIMIQSKNYIVRNFSVRTEDCDVIIGYRADDSYFSYARSWLSNSLPLGELQRALYLGNLGEQLVLKSHKAFEKLRFIEASPVMCEEYYPKYIARDEEARAVFRKTSSNKISSNKTLSNKTSSNKTSSNKAFSKSDIYLMDIIREEMTGEDARIQRLISGRCNK